MMECADLPILSIFFKKNSFEAKNVLYFKFVACPVSVLDMLCENVMVR